MQFSSSIKSFFLVLVLVLVAAMSTGAQPEPDEIYPLVFASHIHAGLLEQDVFVMAEDGMVRRVDADEPIAVIAQPIYAAAEMIEHDPFKIGENPAGPFAAGEPLALSLGEWLTASGAGSYAVTGDRATLQARFHNLIPYGIYTVWCSRTTVSPQVEIVDLPCGAQDGSQNTFLADAYGNADFWLEMAALPPSTPETINVIALAYHSDDQTYGASPGDFGLNSHVQIFAMIMPE